jgi:hypothetical protein
MIFLSTKLIKFPWVTFFFSLKLLGHLFHLFSICAGQHLESEEIPLLQVWRVNEITFSCTSEEIQEHLSDQTSPFVLLPQVFLIKNVISLINSLLPLQLALLFSRVYAHTDSHRGWKAREKWDLSPILSAWNAFLSPFVFEREHVFYLSLNSLNIHWFCKLSSNVFCQMCFSLLETA